MLRQVICGPCERHEPDTICYWKVAHPVDFLCQLGRFTCLNDSEDCHLKSSDAHSGFAQQMRATYSKPTTANPGTLHAAPARSSGTIGDTTIPARGPTLTTNDVHPGPMTRSTPTPLHASPPRTFHVHATARLGLGGSERTTIHHPRPSHPTLRPRGRSTGRCRSRTAPRARSPDGTESAGAMRADPGRRAGPGSARRRRR